MGIFSNKVFFSTISGIEDRLNTVDLSFLFRKAGEVSNLKFLLAGRVVDIIKNFWEIDMNGNQISLKTIKNITTMIAQEIHSENIKLGNFKFIVEDEKLYLKNGDLIIVEFTDDKVTFFMEMDVKDVDAGGLKASMIVIDDAMSSDEEITLFENSPVFRKNFANELVTRGEFEKTDAFLREYVLGFEDTAKKVEAIINSDRTPTFSIDGVELKDSNNINLSTSSIILLKENLPKLYLSELKEIDSNYFSDENIYSTFQDGYVKLTFSEEFTAFYIGTQYYVVQFLDDLDRSIQVGVKENHLEVLYDQNIKVYKFNKDYEFVEEIAANFPYGPMMLVNATKNFLKSRLVISYDITNVFNETYTGKRDIIINEGISFSLEPVVSYSGDIVTNQDTVNFYQREFTDYSGELGFGYYTEEEVSKNRKFSYFDFSNGMIEEDTGNRISVSNVNFTVYIPAKINFTGYKENLFKVGGEEYNLSQDLDLKVSMAINKGKVITLNYEDRDNALGDSTDQDAWDAAVRELLINARMINEAGDLINIYFSDLQIHKILVEKTLEFEFEVVTEIKNFRFTDDITLIPRSLSDGNIFLNNSSADSYVFTIDRSGKDYYGEVMSEKVKFSYSNFTELINNIEVEKVTFEIYDNLNFNPVTGENKSTQSPTSFIFKKIDGIFYTDRDYGGFTDVDNLSVYTQFNRQNIDSFIYVKLIIDRKFENKQVVFDKKYKISDLDLSLTYTLNSIEQNPGDNTVIKADIEGIEQNDSVHNIYMRTVCEDFRGIEFLRMDFDFTESNDLILKNFPVTFNDFYSKLKFKPINKMSINQSITTDVKKTMKVKWRTDKEYNSVILANNFEDRKWSLSTENTMNKRGDGYEIYWSVEPGENLKDREFKFLVNGREFVCPPKHELELNFNGVSLQFDVSESLDNLYCWNFIEDNFPETVHAFSLFNMEEYAFNDKVLFMTLKYKLDKALGNSIEVQLRTENRIDLSQLLYTSKIEYLADLSGVFRLLDTKNNARSFSYSNAMASPNFMILSRVNQGSPLIEEFSDQPRVRFHLDKSEIFTELRVFKLNISQSGAVTLGEEMQTAFNPSESFYYLVSQEEETYLDFLNNKSYAILGYNQNSDDYSDIRCSVEMTYKDRVTYNIGEFTIFNYSIRNRFERTFVDDFSGFVVDDEIKFNLGIRLGSKMLSSLNIIGDITYNNRNMLSNVAFKKYTLLSGGEGEHIEYSEDNAPSTTFNFLIEETLVPGVPPEKRDVDLLDPEIYNVKYINETSFVTEEVPYLDLRCYDNTGDYKFKLRQIDERLPEEGYISATDYSFPALKDVGTFFAVREVDVNEEFYTALLSKYYQGAPAFENFYDIYAFEDKKGLNFSSQAEKEYYFSGEKPYKYYGDISFTPVEMDAGIPTDLTKFKADLAEDFETPISMKVEFEDPIYLSNIRKYSKDTRLKAFISMEARTSRSLRAHEVSLDALAEVPKHPNVLYEPCNLKSVFAYLSGVVEVFNGIQNLNIGLKIVSEDVELNLINSDTYIGFPKIRADISKSEIGETSAVLLLKEPLKGEDQGSIDGEIIEYLDVFVELINENRQIMGVVHQDQLELAGLNPITPYRIRVIHKIIQDVHVISDDIAFTTEIPEVYVRELYNKKYGAVEFMVEGADNFLSRCYSFDILRPEDIKGDSPVDEGDFYDTEDPVIGNVTSEEQNKRLLIRVMANKNGKSTSNIPIDLDGNLDFTGAPYFYTQPKDMPEAVRSILETSGNSIQLHFSELDYPTDVRIKCMVVDEEGIISYVII